MLTMQGQLNHLKKHLGSKNVALYRLLSCALHLSQDSTDGSFDAIILLVKWQNVIDAHICKTWPKFVDNALAIDKWTDSILYSQ